MTGRNGQAPVREREELVMPLQAVQAQQQQAAIAGTVLVAGYDAKDGTYRLLNLDVLRQLAVQAERLYALDRVDSRNAHAEATIGAGAAIGAEARARITVPAGEVWYVNRAVHVSPAESGVGVGDIIQTNLRISRWTDPAADPDGKAYNAAAIGTAALDTTIEELPAQGELGEELRLEPGDVVTLVATLTGAVAGAALTATLDLFGRLGKPLAT